MHITILSLLDDNKESRLSEHAGLELDYIQLMSEDEDRPETCVKTVKDVRALSDEDLLHYAMLEENGMLYDNPFDIMTEDQVLEMYKQVLSCYDDKAPVAVYDAHI